MKRLLAVLAFAAAAAKADEAARQEMRGAVSNLVEICAEQVDYYYVLECGLSKEVTSQAAFPGIRATLSNHWEALMGDWAHYYTNDFRRVVVCDLAGYAGTNAFLGMWGRLVDIASTNQALCPTEFLFNFSFAPTTPLDGYLVHHFDDPVVSNLVLRTLALPLSAGKIESYRGILSGEWRAEELEILSQ